MMILTAQMQWFLLCRQEPCWDDTCLDNNKTSLHIQQIDKSANTDEDVETLEFPYPAIRSVNWCSDFRQPNIA